MSSRGYQKFTDLCDKIKAILIPSMKDLDKTWYWNNQSIAWPVF